MSEARPPLVIVLTGPSGVGKDSVFDRMVARGVPVARPATMTTRAPRPGEQEGVHHYFVTPEEFERAFEAGELLERSGAYGNQYGVPRRAVQEALASGMDVVLRVDIRGAESLRPVLEDAVFVCLIPERLGDLESRLDERATETTEEREKRLAMAPDEIERATRFCAMVVNPQGRLDDTVDEILRLVESERSRVANKAAPEDIDWPARPNQPRFPSGFASAAGSPVPDPATSEEEAERIAQSTRAGRSTSLVRDALLIEVALSAIRDARRALVELEGRGIEKALIEELVLPELDWVESALHLDTPVVEELLEARNRVWKAHNLLSKATRAFQKAGAWAVAGVLGNAAYWLIQAVPGPNSPFR